MEVYPSGTFWVDSVYSRSVDRRRHCAPESPKTQIPGPPPARVPGSVGLDWGLRSCISGKLPDATDVAGPFEPMI